MSIEPLLTIRFPMQENKWTNLDLNLGSHLLIAIIVIGVVGLAIEQGMNLVAKRFDYRSH